MRIASSAVFVPLGAVTPRRLPLQSTMNSPLPLPSLLSDEEKPVVVLWGKVPSSWAADKGEKSGYYPLEGSMCNPDARS